jgi:hypothetical protein
VCPKPVETPRSALGGAAALVQNRPIKKSGSMRMSEHAAPADPSAIEAWLDEANAIHADTPEPALALLRRIAPAALPPARRPQYAFLMNHVPGEKFGHWDEALAAQRAILQAAGDAATPVLWRQAAVAAHLAGAAEDAARWRDALAAAAGASARQAQAVIELAAVSFTAAAQDAAGAGRAALEALRPLAGLAIEPGLDAAFAAAANGLGGQLVDRPLDDLRQPDLRAALAQSAALALGCWQRAGQWLQQERAHYLCALAANALGEGSRAEAHAREGLALLDANDDAHAEDVDRAFLELECALALELAGAQGGDAARARAEALAAAFGSASLQAWFADRRQRNAALLAHYQRGPR